MEKRHIGTPNNSKSFHQKENNHGIVLLTFTILSFFLSQTYAEEVSTAPSQVVGQWLQSYPHDLSQAVTFTSPDFRDNLAPSEWITHKESILRQIRLQYLDKQFLKEEIDENRTRMVKKLISPYGIRKA